MRGVLALAATLACVSASSVWNDFSKPFYDDFSNYKEGDLLNPSDWVIHMRDWGLVGKNHYPYLSDNDPSDRRCYQNNGVSPANVYIKANQNVQYLPRLGIPTQNKNVLALRAHGDNTPAGAGYPAGIAKKFKIDSYKDTASENGRWLVSPNNNQRVGSTFATYYYFGPGSFEVGMKPLQDFGATTTIWAYHYNEFYPETPDPLQVHQTEDWNDPMFVANCFINPGDNATNPGANCSCPLNSFPAHPWQQQEMGEFDHWWAENSEIDIEFPTPANNTPQGLMVGMANMMRFNTWKGQCGVQYTYSFQVVQTLDSQGNVVPVPPTPGFHDGFYHVWLFNWFGQGSTVGPQRVEFFIDGVAQRNVTWMNPTDPDPRVRQTLWEFEELMPHRPMRLWIGVWFSYWGTASPAACLTDNDQEDPFSRPCATWGNAANPEDPTNPVWREALVDYVKITPNLAWGSAVWWPELYGNDGLALTEYPYALPYANTNAGTLPAASSTGLFDDFADNFIHSEYWLVSRANWSPRLQTIWGQMCHGNICKGSLQDPKGAVVKQVAGGFNVNNVIPGQTEPTTGNTVLTLRTLGDLYNGNVIGHDEIGGYRTDGHKTGAMIATAQYFGPGTFEFKVALAGAAGPGVIHSIILSEASAWEENSDQFKAHCSNAEYMPADSDCRAYCLNPTGWPKGTGFWQEKNFLSLDVPFYTANNHNPDGYSYNNARVGYGIGVCNSGAGVGANGTTIPMGTPEYQETLVSPAVQGDPFHAGGKVRFVDVKLEWHTWANDNCPRSITWSVDGNVIYQSGCDAVTQAILPVTALRVAFAVAVNESAGFPWWEQQAALLESVTITQFDEPCVHDTESFPYQDYAEAETHVGGLNPSKATGGGPSSKVPLSAFKKVAPKAGIRGSN